MALAPEEREILRVAKDILKEIRSPKPDPDQVLETLKTKIKQARMTNNDLRNGTDSTGIPTLTYGGLGRLEGLVEVKCQTRPGFFKTRRAELESKQKTEKLTNEVLEKRKEKIEQRHEHDREKATEKAMAAHQKGNVHLAHYDENNLLAVARDHAGALTPPERNDDGTIKSGVAMAAAVFDATTNTYFVGRSGHGKNNGNGHVPVGIWNTILSSQVDPSDDAFGKNCAEVDCLLKAFAARAPAQRVPPLTGLTFVAYKVGENKHRGPCKTCKSWILQYGAKYLGVQ
jgi:hypothetical protein